MFLIELNNTLFELLVRFFLFTLFRECRYYRMAFQKGCWRFELTVQTLISIVYKFIKDMLSTRYIVWLLNLICRSLVNINLSKTQVTISVLPTLYSHITFINTTLVSLSLSSKKQRILQKRQNYKDK